MNGNNQKPATGIVGIIVQAGAVGLALVAIYGMWSLASNHIRHNTEVLFELKASVDNLNETGKGQVQVLRSLERLIELKIR